MKALLTVLTILISSSVMAQNTTKRVLMMVSEGFYASEYYKPLKEFKKAGFHITTATKYKRAINPDERQLATDPAIKGDITFKEINIDDYDAIVFAGGNGAWEDFFPNKDVHRALTHFMNSTKLVALLCSATGLLGVANNLDGMGTPLAAGRNVTGYKRVEGLLTQLGHVNYSEGEKDKPYVVVDGNLITGRDPLFSELFAKMIVKQLLTRASEHKD
jgi:putative intracellular protease/amidase